MSAFVQSSLVIIGTSGAALAATYVYRAFISPDGTGRPAAYQNRKLVTLAAVTLSESVVSETLHDAAVLDELANFGLKVLTDKGTVAALKSFFKKELVDEPTASRAALKDFIVDDVILDDWVAEELIHLVERQVDYVKQDEALYPTPILGHWLGGAALRALSTRTFLSAIKENSVPALWATLLGPPPLSLVFNPPFPHYWARRRGKSSKPQLSQPQLEMYYRFHNRRYAHLA